MVASLVSVPPASAQSPASSHDAGIVSRFATWLSQGISGLFAEDPKGEMRPGKTPVALPGRDGKAAEQPRQVKPPGKRVKELTEKRTANGKVWQLDDGRLQLELSSEPVHFQDGKGSWQNIDTQLRAKNGVAAANDTAGFGSVFGGRSSSLAEVELDGRRLRLGVPGEDRQITPKVTGSTATYANVWDGVDLIYKLTPTGLKELVVLNKAPSAPLEFTLKTDGVQAQAQRDGSIAFVGADGATAFTVPKPFMIDQTSDPASPYGKSHSEKVTQTVTDKDGQATITLTPDAGWLAAPERKWPVVIDPTLRISPERDDTYIDSAKKTTNFDEAWQLPVGKTATGINRSLLNFYLPMPIGTVVDDARLETYFDQALGEAGPVTVEAREITGDWDSWTVTWNTQPTVAATPIATVTRNPGELSRWHSFNVTGVVNKWMTTADEVPGFMLKAADESATGKVGGPVYESSEDVYGGDGMIGETTNHPRLIITYGKPSVVLQPGDTVTSQGASLSWSAYADPTPADSSDDLAEYRLHRTCPSGCQNSPTEGYDTLVASIGKDTTTYTDTSSGGDPEAVADESYIHEATYWVEAVLANGQVTTSQKATVVLPRPGLISTTIYGSADTALASGEPTATHDGKRLAAGNTTGTPGNTRAVIAFAGYADKIPADAKVTEASLSLWNANATGTGASFAAHKLTKAFDESATWTSPWTTAGGDFEATALSSVSGLTAAPGWKKWDVTAAATAWSTDPATNHGLLVKVANEAGTSKQAASFLSTEGDEPVLRPRLRVTYLEKSEGSSAFYAPETPLEMDARASAQVPVTVTNTTTQTWPAGTTQLSYRWKLPDGTDLSAAANQIKTALPEALPPGESVLVTANVTAPALTGDGTNKAEATTLDWDIYDSAAGTWKSASHHTPQHPQRIRLTSPTSDQLGSEKFYTYSGKNTGAGGAALVNTFAGNLNWSYNALSNPSRGPQTFIRTTYNSLDTASSSMGYGWSLQTSTLQRLGTALAFEPRRQTWPNKVRLTDGDGTTHVWTLNKHGNSTCNPQVCDYTNPKGVHLYLQRVADPNAPTHIGRDPLRRWVFTKPDRTQFFFDEEGYQSAIVDANGNTMSFAYERRNECFGKVTKFLQHITDATGRRTLSLDYYKKGQDYTYIDGNGQEVSGRKLSNKHIIDQVKSVTDIAGRKVTFTYTIKGLMARMVDGAGDATAKTFAFGYDAGWGNQNAKLTDVTDPRGNITSFTYHRTPVLGWCKLRVETIKDRLGGVTRFDYNDGPFNKYVRTTVTDPLNNATKYVLDPYGRAEQVTNAKNETTALQWDADHNVVKLTEANQAYATWKYDPKTGYPLELRDAEANTNNTAPSTLVYQAGLNGYVADLIEKTSPEGRKWAFGYNAQGSLLSVTDPLGVASSTAGDYTTRYEYNGYGQLTKSTDANTNSTAYGDYDPSGYPKTIIDAYNKVTATVYDVRGNVLSVTDALGGKTTQAYDLFNRPLESKVPKDQANGVFITTPAPVYDANDNVTKMIAPNGAVSTAVYDKADQLTEQLLPKDTTDSPERKATITYDAAGNIKTQTEPKGNLTSTAGDYTTTYVYDPIYQLTEVVNAAQQKITYSYDNVGDVTTVVDPRKNATSDAADYTTAYTYDRNHQVKTVKDPAGHQTSTDYDRDGLPVGQTDQEGNKTITVYDGRGSVVETRVPHSSTDGVIKYVTTQYAYDQAGNQTKAITPRGVETTDDPGDFLTETKYDKLNRPVEEIYPYDKDDATYNQPDSVKYVYDELSRLREISAPPSHGQTVRNVSTMTYWDTGWNKTSTDAWGIQTSYDYNTLGLQTNRTVTSAGGSSQRAMDWSYYPDGKLKTHSDNGVPLDIDVLFADNSDVGQVQATGTFTARTTAAPTTGPKTTKSAVTGYDFAAAPAGTGKSAFTWTVIPNTTGTYQVWATYPAGATATNAVYTIDGDDEKTVDQTKHAGEWVKLGSNSFTAGKPATITLTDDANGTVAADAVKLVRDTNAADVEKKDFGYVYDPNANLTQILDNTTTAKIDDWAITYTGLNQIDKIVEKLDGVVKNTTTYAYNENSAVTELTHDKTRATYTYDVRDLVDSVTNRKSATDTKPKVTRYTYTPRGERLKETKANGNTVDYDYFLTGLLRHSVEKKSNGTIVAEHTLGYQGNLQKASDHTKIQNADSLGAYLEHDYAYTYDPRDRIAKTVKTPTGGGPAETETYKHDANNNVYDQSVGGKQTTFTYDRNRLITSTADGATASQGYDVYGRLRTVTAAGTTLEKYTYDGFDHVTKHETLGSGGTTNTVTTYTFDPLDRTTSRTEKEGTATAKTTTYSYLGLSAEVLDEEVAGKLTKSFQYNAWGERLSQVKVNTDGTEESSYYGYNAHSDVEQITKENGDSRATYGYTAYGSNDDKLFTGVDKPDSADPTAKEEYNPYRFNAKRWDNSTGIYDMGFRDYNPGLNRFLNLDSYNDALDDLSLGLDPWTANRYAFTGGNPINEIELDGHNSCQPGDCPQREAGLRRLADSTDDKKLKKTYTRLANKAAKADAALYKKHRQGRDEADVALGKWIQKGQEEYCSAFPLCDWNDHAVADGLIGEGEGVLEDALWKILTRKGGKGSSKKKLDGSDDECNSFAPGTQVLMADGTRKPIEEVELGDKVLATDPETGETVAKPVVALITGEGQKNLVQITVDPGSEKDGESGVIIATEGHPFWLPETGEWVDAGDLKSGDWLQTSAGTYVLVSAIEKRTADRQRVHNLTIADINTYYVDAGDVSVLVHNTTCPIQLAARAREIWDAEPNVYTKEKHSTVSVVAARDGKGNTILVVAANGAGLTAGQKKALQAGEHLAFNVPGTHAEQNAILFINQMGWTPIAGGSSRNICRKICAPLIKASGAKIVGPIYPGSNKTTRQRSFVWDN
ncbi:DNRLRE domain-containing protein [Nonomuraea sp. NPDC050404]|uniref:DNRLRE domain-containing protein n=1 Tax=Nonomuraea sp. NPDC050404 TaxID=3155783 RepID=UPI0033D9FC77